MNEADVSTKIRLALVTRGATAWKCSDRFHASRPDLIACYKGQFIALETKIYPKDPTLAQDFILKELARIGAWAYVVWYSIKQKIYFAKSYNSEATATHSSLEDMIEWLFAHNCSSTNKNL